MPKAALSDYLAAERTFLAWVRTGLALMGFGFVVARFGLFLQQIQLVNHQVSARSTGVSLWFGTSLIAVGIAVNLASAWRHIRLVRELDEGHTGSSRSLTLVVATALFLALVGLAMAVYLFTVRSSADIHSTANGVSLMANISDAGIVRLTSNHCVDETVKKLQEILQAKGVTIFSIVDHSGEAAKVGLRMPNTKLLIFGSPKAGTPLMLAAPGVALDLPLKILVAEDADGKTWLSYNSPAYLRERHGFPQELSQNIAVVASLAAESAK